MLVITHRITSREKRTGMIHQGWKASWYLLLLTVFCSTSYGQDAAKRADNLPAGINDSFLDPNMKVEDFIKRFEVESREVFACRKQILEAIQLKPGMAVADVGSGTGLYLGPYPTALVPRARYLQSTSHQSLPSICETGLSKRSSPTWKLCSARTAMST